MNADGSDTRIPASAELQLNPGELLRDRADLYFERYGRPRRDARILVALSGGPDSVALLALLLDFARHSGWHLEAAHVNYGLRGDESDGDESFCRQLSQTWNVPLHVQRVDKPDSAALNVQAWARGVRYKYFNELASSRQFDHVAVGHTLDDRAESVAAAVIEARGTFALSGIPPVRGKIIRPLFLASRSQVTDFLEAHGVSSRIDSSNLTGTYLRNRVRREVLPGWRTLNPSIDEGLARLGEQLWRQESFLFSQAEKIIQTAISDAEGDRIIMFQAPLAQHDEALDPFVLRLLARRIGSDELLTPATVERFGHLRRAGGTGRVEQGDLAVECSKGCVIVSRRCRTHGEQPTVGFLAGESFRFGRCRYRSEIVESFRDTNYDDRMAALMDLDRVRQPLVMRRLEPGDRYQPVGLHGHKKIADLLADRGVPAPLRRDVAILTDADGVLWPVGHPIAERAKITTKTKVALRVVVEQV